MTGISTVNGGKGSSKYNQCLSNDSETLEDFGIVQLPIVGKSIKQIFYDIDINMRMGNLC